MTIHCPTRRGYVSAVSLTILLSLAPRAGAGEVDVGDVALTYEDQGTGEIVLFVHGAVSDHRVWAPFRERVAEAHRFVAYDQRYFGPAAWPNDGAAFSVSSHADDLVRLVDELGAGPVNLVTWSYGGLVGIHAALRHPEKFRSIVHFEPTVESLHSGLSGERAALAQKFASFGPMADALQRGEEEQAVRRLIEAVFRLEPGAADNFPADAQRLWDDNARTLPPFLEAIAEAEPISCEDLGKLDTPTLVIQGGGSYVLDAMMSDEVARCQPNASALVLENANHGGPVQEPDAFIDAVLGFVESFE